MKNNLDLLDELLTQDPGSKIFFPLAKLYRKQGEGGKALEVLRKGIANHPQFLEAQLFMIDLLQEHQCYEEAEATAMDIFERLQSSHSFWRTLHAGLSKKRLHETAFAAFVFGQAANHESIDFFALLREGTEKYTQNTTELHTEPEFDLDADEVTQICINSGIRTKTMAKLLAAQGEVAQALGIYNELISSCQDQHERYELLDLRNQLQKSAPSAQDESSHKKVYRILDKLASRLESKYAQ